MAPPHVVAVVHDADDEAHDDEEAHGGQQGIVINHPAGREAVGYLRALMQDHILGEIGRQMGDFLVQDAPEPGVSLSADTQADIFTIEAFGESFQIVGERTLHKIGDYRPGGISHIGPAIADSPETFFHGVAVDDLVGTVVFLDGNLVGENLLNDCHLGILGQGEALADDGGVVNGAERLGG